MWGYNAILISTIVDPVRSRAQKAKGYNAILISTIVDTTNGHERNHWAIMLF